MAIFINYYRLKEILTSDGEYCRLVSHCEGDIGLPCTRRREEKLFTRSNFMLSVMPIVSVFYYFPNISEWIYYNTRRLLLSWFLEVLSHLKTVKLRFENGQLGLAAITLDSVSLI